MPSTTTVPTPGTFFKSSKFFAVDTAFAASVVIYSIRYFYLPNTMIPYKVTSMGVILYGSLN